MTWLLGKTQLETLAQLAWARALLAFDFDGTLSPLVADRGAAVLPRQTAALLRQVSALYPTAVISGRSRADVVARLGDVGVRYVVGNHGLEPLAHPAVDGTVLDEARQLLQPVLVRVAGLELEDKQCSLTVHYRQARRKAEAQQAVRRALAGSRLPLRLIGGKYVINVLPAGAPHKGDALLALREREGADVALYLGDDDTDEDVFALDQPGRLMTVRVGKKVGSAATFYLGSQREVDTLLRRLISSRAQARR